MSNVEQEYNFSPLFSKQHQLMTKESPVKLYDIDGTG